MEERSGVPIRVERSGVPNLVEDDLGVDNRGVDNPNPLSLVDEAVPVRTKVLW